MDTYLSYRIGLKTFSVAESRIVLGAPDAFELPTAPGNGYLKFDTTGLVRFKGAYVSGPVRDPRVGADDLGWVDPQAFRLVAEPAVQPARHATGVVARDQRRRSGSVHRRRAAPTPHGTSATTGSAQTLLDVAVSRLAGSGVPAHEVWLPPLNEPPSLDLLLPEGSVRGALGTDGVPVPATAFLQVPLGWVDKPFEQTRGLLTIDMSGAAGHVAIVGAPQSGKSTAVRSLVCALALTHTPEEVQVYCLDFGGGSLEQCGRASACRRGRRPVAAGAGAPHGCHGQPGPDQARGSVHPRRGRIARRNGGSGSARVPSPATASVTSSW